MGSEEQEGYVALFETKKKQGREIYRVFAVTIFVGICLIWTYRLSHIPRDDGDFEKWMVWIGLFLAELWFGMYWILTQSLRWNQVHRSTFKDRLSHRHEKDLPVVDIFVCTADPKIEPPMLVINTVLSVMAYDYPPEKLNVYLSDDGGSELTFYALLEASSFAKHWMPFCKKFNVEPRSPVAYFRSMSDSVGANMGKDFVAIKKLYEEMEDQINTAVKLDRISNEIRSKHKGFSQWDSFSSQREHPTILQILIDGRDPNARDNEGCVLPTLVYLSREKRPQHFHNFKAGAMNSLIRVSSNISNGEIILNVDCDMYSNNSESLRDALCFFMDEEKGHEIAFVQFPQNFNNITNNDIYGSCLLVINKVEFHGMDGYGGPLYIGTGCFHRRDTLCGRKFSEGYRNQWKGENFMKKREENALELEESSKGLASCTYEQNTQWGKEVSATSHTSTINLRNLTDGWSLKFYESQYLPYIGEVLEMGLKYGCPVEDVITGLSIQCRGWKSIYFNPERMGFLGVAPSTLAQSLVQHKRWSEGDLQILLSKYSPAWYGLGKISLGQQMGYCTYCLWAPNCCATLYYSVIPSLYLLKGIPLFPEISSPWFLPFAYVILAKYTYSLAEFLLSGGTVLGWWNEQRMWLFKRTSSYFFAFIDTILKLLGFSESTFVITAKVADEDVSQRYEQELMEFGTSSPMFTILTTLALLNLFCFVAVVKEAVMDSGTRVFEEMGLQIILCGILFLVNLPLYRGLFLRKDMGKMPSSLTVKSVALALFACAWVALL